MAINGYHIDTASARSVVGRARDRFETLDGIEQDIDFDGDAAVQATDEDEIITAFSDAYTNYLHPFTVTMIQAGRNVFTTTDNIITIYNSADDEMAEKAKGEMGGEIRNLDDLPDYAPEDSTGPGTRSHGGGGTSAESW